jgi:hypothetical protein
MDTDSATDERAQLLAQLRGIAGENSDLRAENDRFRAMFTETAGATFSDLVSLRAQLEAVGAENKTLKRYIEALVEQLQAVGNELATARNMASDYEDRQITRLARIYQGLDYLESVRGDSIPKAMGYKLVLVEFGEKKREVGSLEWRRWNTPAILLVALPRSASVFLTHALRDGLQKNTVGVMAGANPDYVIVQHAFRTFVHEHAVAHTHLPATRGNLIEISARHQLDRLVVHVRDPRQALMSWVHFIRSVVTDLDPVQALHYGLPEDYLSLDPGQQIDWQIENWLPRIVSWIAGWMEAKSEPLFKTEILFTTFEQLKEDQKRFFDRLLDFYGIERELFAYPALPKVGESNFRQGDVDEWRREMTPEQQSRLNALIPDQMLSFFGWER